MKFLKELINKYISKPKAQEIPKTKYKNNTDLNTVYCYKIVIPSKECELTINAYNELDALCETLSILRLTELPEDIKITEYSDAIDSYYWHNYVFKNKQKHLVNIKDYIY